LSGSIELCIKPMVITLFNLWRDPTEFGLVQHI
jgi:hypothetical protein